LAERNVFIQQQLLGKKEISHHHQQVRVGKRTDNILEREANVETIRHRCTGKKGEI
jgi:hypothetical protein